MLVEATGLCKSFGDTRVLDGVDLSAAEGEVLALLGPNGAGKTTTVRILTTLLRPDAGAVRIAGVDALRHPAQARAALSLTGQSVAVDERQTGRENLVMVGRLAHLGRRVARARAGELLDRFGLGGAADRFVATYSGGMRRRLDLAMSLVGRPLVLFLDEPTTGLDPASRATMWAAIGELVDTGTTIVLTTQYLEEADRLASRVVLVDGGRVTASGTPDQLKARVGGDRLEVRLTDARDLTRAAAAVPGAVVDPGRRLLTLPTDGTAAHLHTVLDRLRDAGLPVERVAAARPTLDDAFLVLTGTPPASPARDDAVPVPA
ncbi:ABC-2 type transport system ATP-binding protein [Geodermatophilus normandii]|uniref:ABC-2 type transport system ATP-binding protein n=1 Tax=Geodermatophilus normandii TaxID=1137989 RepID=A0A317QRJ3_9ACTN|nr:ATP-binding cassette domain-containing protein [Geodermatophilus normandii]PWW24330.1 ABC-2 type transport system ATP-binding protein [Geodermatophilus normandii]